MESLHFIEYVERYNGSELWKLQNPPSLCSLPLAWVQLQKDNPSLNLETLMPKVSQNTKLLTSLIYKEMVWQNHDTIWKLMAPFIGLLQKWNFPMNSTGICRSQNLIAVPLQNHAFIFVFDFSLHLLMLW